MKITQEPASSAKLRGLRRQFSPEEKVQFLRLHLLEGKSISAICDEHQFHPTLFYQWQKTFFENGASLFVRSPKRRENVEQQRLAFLEAKLRGKDEVIALVTEELIKAKKELGEF